MKIRSLQSAAFCGLLAYVLSCSASPEEFSFGVISPSLKAALDETTLRNTIEKANGDNLAFIVTNGIKAADEPCTDQIYNERKALLQNSKNGLIVSLSASDWAECKNGSGKSSALGKLSRLRDLFFTDDFSFGDSRIPLVRQSDMAKFRSYAENARWQVGDTMFVTINLPSNNNHYVPDAGRNSEFEDRLVANRDWLHRIFTYTNRKKLTGIVLFCDGNPLTEEPEIKRDGFVETRRYLISMARKFPGKILVIHGQGQKDKSTSPTIIWRGNIGELAAGDTQWIKLTANASAPIPFTIDNE